MNRSEAFAIIREESKNRPDELAIITIVEELVHNFNFALCELGNAAARYNNR